MSTAGSLLRLEYFPTNQAWAFTFGRDRRHCSIIRMGDSQLLFPSREEAHEAARRQGLTINQDLTVICTGG